MNSAASSSALPPISPAAGNEPDQAGGSCLKQVPGTMRGWLEAQQRLQMRTLVTPQRPIPLPPPTNHDDALRLRVLHKPLQAVHKVGACGDTEAGFTMSACTTCFQGTGCSSTGHTCPIPHSNRTVYGSTPIRRGKMPMTCMPTVEGVAADAHHRALPEPLVGGLEHGLVGQRACTVEGERRRKARIRVKMQDGWQGFLLVVSSSCSRLPRTAGTARRFDHSMHSAPERDTMPIFPGVWM